MSIAICTIVRILLLQLICTHPQTQPRVIVPRTIVIQSRLFVEFLRVEEIRRIPDAVPLFNEHFAERHILDVLNHLTVQVGDVAAAAQVVGMVVELQLLVCVRILEIVFQCQGTGLRRFGRTVVATESLSVHIVVVVRSVVRHLKDSIIILNYLLLGGIFLFIINRKSVRLTAGILDASRVGTVEAKSPILETMRCEPI